MHSVLVIMHVFFLRNLAFFYVATAVLLSAVVTYIFQFLLWLR